MRPGDALTPTADGATHHAHTNEHCDNGGHGADHANVPCRCASVRLMITADANMPAMMYTRSIQIYNRM